MITETSTNSDQQKFFITKSGISYTIQAKKGGAFLDISGESKKVHGTVILYKQNDRNNQLFDLLKMKDDTYRIVNVNSKLDLEILGGIDEEGIPVVQNKFYNTKNQLWRI